MAYYDRKSVEILPWLHYADKREHQDIIEYLKSLPKGSNLALEITPNMLRIIEREIDRSKGIDIPKETYMMRRFETKESSLSEYSESYVAWFELIMTCRSRGIEIIPIEPPIVDNMKGLGNLTASMWREQRFYEKILDALHNINRLYVAVGLAHATSLEELLRKEVSVRINTDLFGERKLMVEDALRLEREYRAMYFDRNIPYQRLELNRSDFRELYTPRHERLNNLRGRLVSELRKRQTSGDKRIVKRIGSIKEVKKE